VVLGDGGSGSLARCLSVLLILMDLNGRFEIRGQLIKRSP
jgi:hypothetical protein